MLTEQAKTTLKAIGHAIKAVAPDLTGQVTFDFASNLPEPKVTITACNVTKEEKNVERQRN